jgi:hypothetical protein
MEEAGRNFIPEAQQPIILSAFSHALEAAQTYEGMTGTNPPVGWVLLDVLEESWRLGTPSSAFSQLWPSARSGFMATAFVSGGTGGRFICG